MVLRKEQLLSRLHFFIFGATIVGETAVTSLIVSAFGSEILGKLYLLNGGILLFLPVIFFKKIDSVNRGILLKNVLIVASVLSSVLFTLYLISQEVFPDKSQFILLLFYPVSYLLKTILFLTFWIMSTDVCEPGESKSVFPRVASAGFMGGLCGALISWFFLNFVKAEYILLFWSFLYLVSYFSVNRVVQAYNENLIPKEVLPSANLNHFSSLIDDTREVFKNSLVRNIAILHFGIFISIFLVDYHFWQQCSGAFSGAGKLSQFQYGFYIFHSLLTIFLLRFITPDLIAIRGFTRIFSYLPMTLFIGAFIYANVLYVWGANRFTFSILLGWQLFRYLAFENFFSPIYQMFFAAVEKEKRGRAKTVIEGLVKPLAIISASVLIVILGKHSFVVVIVVCVLSFFLFLEALKIKHSYMKSLIRTRRTDGDEVSDLVINIGTDIENECIDIIQKFAHFSSQDMKRVAIKLLVKMERNESNSALNQLVMQSDDILLVRETARYAGEIRHNMFLLHFLVEHPDPKVWHRSVLSLVLNRTYLTEFRPFLTRYFWVGEPEDRVYAGLYLCSKEGRNDLPHLRSFLDTLFFSDLHCNVELAVLGYTVLQIDSWETKVIANINSVSAEIAKIAIRHIVETSSDGFKIKLIEVILSADHERNYDLLIREIYRSPLKAVSAVNTVMNCLTVSDDKKCGLIKALGMMRLTSNNKYEGSLAGIIAYSESQLVSVYEIAAALNRFPQTRVQFPINELVEIALKDQMLFVASNAIDALALVDETGFLAEGRRELRIEDADERVALIELLESMPDSLLKDLTIPILESFEVDVYANMAGERLTNNVEPQRLLEIDNSVIVGATLILISEIGLASLDQLVLRPSLKILSGSENLLYRSLAVSVLEGEGELMAKNEESIKILNRVLFLKKNELFTSVSAVRLMRLAEGIQEIVYKEGDLISREGDRANHLYLLKTGTANLVVGFDTNPIKFGEIKAGDGYGEVGLFNQDIRSATVVATSNCRVYVLSRSYLRKMVSQIPELANTFLLVLGRKLQTSHDEVVRLQKSVSEMNCL